MMAINETVEQTGEGVNLGPLEQEYEQLMSQVNQLNELVGKLDQLAQASGSRFSFRGGEIDAKFSEAKELLDKTRPYKIAVVGATGAGKSTLLNAFTGRRLLLQRPGQAATGTIITVGVRVSDAGIEPGEIRGEATIHYHTWQSLTEKITKLCQAENITPIYTQGSLDIKEIKKKLSPQQTNESSKITVLRNLLEAARLNRSLLDKGEEQEKRQLDNDAQVRELQDLMDEKSSSNQQRLIRLIKHIECDLYIPKREAEEKELPDNIGLTDTPGTGALTDIHYEILREQLEESDAIIFVMPDVPRPEIAANEIINLVGDRLTRGYDTDDYDVEPPVFLVLNNRTAQGNDRDNILKGFRDVGDKLKPGFCTLFPNRVIDDMNAKEALDSDSTAPNSPMQRLRHELNEFWTLGRWKQRLHVAKTVYSKARQMIINQSDEAWKSLTGEAPGPDLSQDLEAYKRKAVRRYGMQLHKQLEAVHTDFQKACDEIRVQEMHGSTVKNMLEQITREVQTEITNHTRSSPFRQALMTTKQHPRTLKIYTRLGNHIPVIELDVEIFKWFEKRIERVAQVMVDRLNDQLKSANVKSSLQEATYDHSDYNVLANYNRIINMIQSGYEKNCHALVGRLVTSDIVDEILNSSDFKTNTLIVEIPTSEASQVAAQTVPAQTVTPKKPSRPRPPGSWDATNSQQSAQPIPSTPSSAPALSSQQQVDHVISMIQDKYAEVYRELVNTMPPFLAQLFFQRLEEATQEFKRLTSELAKDLERDLGKDGELYKKMRDADEDNLALVSKLGSLREELQKL